VLTSISTGQILDNFESGNLDDWEIVTGGNEVAIDPDPLDQSNHCLIFTTGDTVMRIPWGLPEGEAETLYYRFMYDIGPEGGTVNLHLGPSDPAGTAWGNYYGLTRFNSFQDASNIPDMDVRNGGAYSNVVYEDFEPMRWYHVVMDIDTSTRTYDVYVDAELVFKGAAFRSGYRPTNLEYILIQVITWQSSISNGTVYVDDITIGATPGFAQATAPSPQNGATLNDTWVTLAWRPGDFAVSSDLYVGTDFNDINEGTADTFIGNTTDDFQIIGFPGYPLPEGLQPGTNYYWRVDGINDLNPESPWKGDVWSFWVPSKAAYNPIPPDGMKFIETNASLTWTPGENASLHTVYFGTNADEVANATTGGIIQSATTFNPGPLELETTYYWRVDEKAGLVETKGELWSFTTKRESGGLQAEYYDISPSGTPSPPESVFSGQPILTRIDPGINFEGAAGTSPEPNIVSADGFAVRWTGEIEIPLTGKYTFIPRTADGVVLWINGVENANMWRGQPPESAPGRPLELIAGDIVAIEMWYYQNTAFGGDWTVRLDWESDRFERQTIPAAACSPPVRASRPEPPNGAIDVKQTPQLKWSIGQNAVEHDVYLGTDADAVAVADTSTAGIYQGRQAETSFARARLELNTTCYWRIDEVNDSNPHSPWKGPIWSFTTGDFLVIDDFEDYDTGENQIWYSWHDGLGYGTPDTDLYFVGNGTGSAVGDETTASYTEETIVHGGNQSMPLMYDNNKQGYANYSEVELTLSDVRDWTEENIAELSLWFRGYPASAGSFDEDPVGTYTMTGSGADIWDDADEFHYAFKTLTGAGTIEAQVLSVDNTDPWAKAGVMIRETLDPGSKFTAVYITPGNGCRFQARTDTDIAATSDTSMATAEQIAITAPYWVKLEREVTGSFRAYYSSNGTDWQMIVWRPNLSMTSNVYVGLAVTSHNAGLTCEGKFSNVTITGTVSTQWMNQDIGIINNDAEPLYVAVSNSAGNPVVVVHDDPAAATISTWTEWVIPLQNLADQGIVLSDVDRIAIGLGTQGNVTIPGGSGKMYFDDIRLYQHRSSP
jgi:hypothetical protein